MVTLFNYLLGLVENMHIRLLSMILSANVTRNIERL